MPQAPRPSGKAQRIADKVLGNKKKRRSSVNSGLLPDDAKERFKERVEYTWDNNIEKAM